MLLKLSIDTGPLPVSKALILIVVVYKSLPKHVESYMRQVSHKTAAPKRCYNNTMGKSWESASLEDGMQLRGLYPKLFEAWREVE